MKKEKSKNDILAALKFYSSICCISFTILELVLAIINVSLDFSASTMNIFTIERFIVCFCIAALMAITNKFTQRHSKLLTIIINLCDICVCVFGIGGLVFDWFNFTFWSIATVIGVIFFVYFVVYGIMLLNMKITSQNINKKIREKKEKMSNDKENH